MIAEEALVTATRRATVADLHALLHVINRAYAVEEFFIHGPRVDEEGLRARFAKPDSFFLVVDDDVPGRLAAAVYLQLHGDRGHFGLLSVDPDRQKRGLGKLLVKAVESECRAAGCTSLGLDTINVRDELPGFYRALGFEETGTAILPEQDKLKMPVHLVTWSKPL